MTEGKREGDEFSEDTQANGGRRGVRFFPVFWLTKKIN